MRSIPYGLNIIGLYEALDLLSAELETADKKELEKELENTSFVYSENRDRDLRYNKTLLFAIFLTFISQRYRPDQSKVQDIFTTVAIKDTLKRIKPLFVKEYGSDNFLLFEKEVENKAYIIKEDTKNLFNSFKTELPIRYAKLLAEEIKVKARNLAKEKSGLSAEKKKELQIKFINESIKKIDSVNLKKVAIFKSSKDLLPETLRSAYNEAIQNRVLTHRVICFNPVDKLCRDACGREVKVGENIIAGFREPPFHSGCYCLLEPTKFIKI